MNTKNKEKAKRLNDYFIYNIEPSNKTPGKSFWRKTGAAFINRDRSINLVFDQTITPQMKVQLRLRPQTEAA